VRLLPGIRNEGGFIGLPSIGCFVDGYLLVLPRRHVDSFAKLDDDELNFGLEFANEICQRLRPIYGEYIIAEHGSAGPCDPGAACVDHAHLHLIPLDYRAGLARDEYCRVGGDPLKLIGREGFRVLGEASYVALSVRAGQFDFWPATRFPRQFVRSVSANLLGVGEYFNWREHPFIAKMKRTKDVCDAVFGGSERQASLVGG
jgi:diadenosine tetraphosphate (Ap4A) HIT family hydrolase